MCLLPLRTLVRFLNDGIKSKIFIITPFIPALLADNALLLLRTLVRDLLVLIASGPGTLVLCLKIVVTRVGT